MGATKERKVRWAESATGDAFELKFKNGVLVSKTWFDDEQDLWYGVDLENPERRVI